MDSNHESFWRHNARAVPGKTVSATVKSKTQQMGSTSFKDFQDSVRDAWELGDDEFLKFPIGDERVNKRSASTSTALTVKTHRSNLGASRASESKPAVQVVAPQTNHTQESNNVPEDLITELSLVDDSIGRERGSSEPRFVVLFQFNLLIRILNFRALIAINFEQGSSFFKSNWLPARNFFSGFPIILIHFFLETSQTVQ